MADEEKPAGEKSDTSTSKSVNNFGEADRKKELRHKRLSQLRGQLRQLRHKTADHSNPRVRWFELQQKICGEEILNPDRSVGIAEFR
jgi:hypothetical protein